MKIFFLVNSIPQNFGNRLFHRKMRILLILMLLGISAMSIESNSSQQQKTIRGKVSDDSGETIPGASVMVKGTTIGTVTNSDGEFTLSIPTDAETLVISFVGMLVQEISIGDQTQFNVTLRVETKELEDVVIVGYGIQKKESVVGAISQVGTESLVRSGVSDITNAIAGKLSGVLTMQQTGEPGRTESEIIIRGLSSWNGSQPLILVDGVERSFSDLDPNEIKDISVLKDASATAVFGAKGANGVILVTTQRGTLGKPELSVSISMGVESAAKMPEHIDAYTTMSMLNTAFMNEGNHASLISDYELSQYQNPSTQLNSLRYPDVDWFGLSTNNVAPTSNENIKIRGGNNFVKYFASLGHLYQSDFFKNDNSEFLDSRFWYHRINYRTNLDFNISKSTQFSINMGGDVGIKNQPSGFSWRELFGAPTTMFPAYYPSWVLDEIPDPDYPNDKAPRVAQSFGSYLGNPYQAVVNGSFNRYLSSKLFTDAILNQKLDFITKGLSVKVQASLSTYFQNRMLNASYPTLEYRLEFEKIGVEGENPWFRAGQSDEVYVYPPVSIGSGGLSSDFYRDTYYEVGINYNRSFGNHNVTGLVLGNRQQQNKGTDFPYYNQGLVGRATYNYLLKYMLELNVGYTGSERFSPENRYGIFPSVAAGYTISEEKFFKDALPWMNKLKIRYSDGIVGSDVAANRWLYISDYYIRNGYINEDKGANKFAQWEESHKRDIGFEFGLFNNLFSGSVDLYEEERSNMLLEPRTVTFIVGNTFKELNIGEFKKHGFEVEAEFNKTIATNLNYYIRAIFGYTENRVVFKDDLPYAPEYLRSAGKPIDAMLDGTTLTGTGYYTSVNDIHNNPAALDPLKQNVGDYKYLDYNADGTITDADKHAIEGSQYAPVSYSISSGFSYKNFNFSFMFQGNEGKYVSYDMTFEHEFTKGDYRVHQSQVDYWAPDNPTANHATLHYATLSIDNVAWGGGSGDQGYKLGIPGRTWRDASYVRLKEVYAGYNFKSHFFENLVGISNFQVYFTGNNLFTWTPLIEGDPERKDFRYGFYPQMRRLTLGLSFSF